MNTIITSSILLLLFFIIGFAFYKTLTNQIKKRAVILTNKMNDPEQRDKLIKEVSGNPEKHLVVNKNGIYFSIFASMILILSGIAGIYIIIGRKNIYMDYKNLSLSNIINLIVTPVVLIYGIKIFHENIKELIKFNKKK